MSTTVTGDRGATVMGEVRWGSKRGRTGIGDNAKEDFPEDPGDMGVKDQELDKEEENARRLNISNSSAKAMSDGQSEAATQQQTQK